MNRVNLNGISKYMINDNPTTWKIAFICLVVYTSPAFSENAIWSHNGSTVQVESEGSNRKIYYVSPRKGLPAKGGDLLFNGRQNGLNLSGKAYLFSKKCGPISYEVSGAINGDNSRIELTGVAPRRNSNCEIVETFEDNLVFEISSASSDAGDDNKTVSNKNTDYIEADGETSSNLKVSRGQQYIIESSKIDSKTFTNKILPVGSIASSEQICQTLNHPLLAEKIENINFIPTINGGINDGGRGARWLQDRLGGTNGSSGWALAPETFDAVESNLSECLHSIAKKNITQYKMITKLFLQHLAGSEEVCGGSKIVMESKNRRRPTETKEKWTGTLCADFNYDGRSVSTDFLSPTVSLALLTLSEGQDLLKSSMTAAHSELKNNLAQAKIDEERKIEEEKKKRLSTADLSMISAYSARKKTLLEQVANYTSLGEPDGVLEQMLTSFWVEEEKCVVSYYMSFMGSKLEKGNRFDFNQLNWSGVAMRFKDGKFSVGDEKFYIIANEKVLRDRIEKAWRLAREQCPGKETPF